MSLQRLLDSRHRAEGIRQNPAVDENGWQDSDSAGAALSIDLVYPPVIGSILYTGVKRRAGDSNLAPELD
jgi:hypothetical protein